MNAKRREDMVDVLPKRRILMRHEKSQGNRNTTAYTTILDYNIQSTTQGMTQALCTGEHLHRMIGSDGFSPDLRVQFYMSPYACTRSTLPKLKLSKKRIIGMREESRVREWDFENFPVEERMKVIKERITLKKISDGKWPTRLGTPIFVSSTSFFSTN